MVLRIRSEMDEKGIKQKDVVAYLQESQSAVAKWLSLNEKIRNDLPNTILLKIAKLLDVDPEYLVGMQDEKRTIYFNNPNFSTPIPLVTNTMAGAGSQGIIPDIVHAERLPVSNRFLNGANPEYLSILQVAGDSMMPTIMPNDWVIIDMVTSTDGTRTRAFEKIDGIYLINKDGSIQIKRLEFKGDRGVDIISDNTAYSRENTMRDGIELYIVGKLFKHIHDLGALAIKELE